MNYTMLPAFVLILLSSCAGGDTGDTTRQGIEWSELPSPPAPFRYAAAVALDGRMYVAGGDNGGAFCAYDPARRLWSDLASLPQARSFVGAASTRDSIFVVGGIDTSGSYSGRVDRYSVQSGTWCTSVESVAPRSRFTLSEVDSKLYAIGGLVGSSDQDFVNSPIVEAYNPETGEWSRRSEMPTPRHGHSAAVFDGKIYVVGGYVNDSANNAMKPSGSVEVYDPATDSWEAAEPMPTPRGFHGAVVVDSVLYAIGGRVRNNRSPVELFDLVSNHWTQIETLPVRRQRFGMASIAERIFIVGGEENPNRVDVGTVR